MGLVARDQGWFSGVHWQDASLFALPAAAVQKAWLYLYHADKWRVKKYREMERESIAGGPHL